MSLFGSVYNEDDASEPLEAAPVTLQELADSAFAALGDEPPAGTVTEVVSEPAPPLEEAVSRAEPVASTPDVGVAASFAALSVPVPVPEPEAPEAPEAPPTAAAPSLPPGSAVSDDLLPTKVPRRQGMNVSLPSVAWGDRQTLLRVAAVLLMAVVGFVGYRTLLGTGSEQAAPTTPPPPAAGTPLPDSPGEALREARNASGRAALRQATTSAAATFAEQGTFTGDAAVWGQRLEGVTVVSGPPRAGALSVTADADVACFETLLPTGTTLAAAVTADGVRSSSATSGATLCTTDAAALAAWSPGLPA